MASLLTDHESEAVGYDSESDDCKSIRRDCKTVEDWQSQLIRSLKLAGWECGMLLFLPAPLPLHWILILRHECSFSLLDEMTVESSRAYQICGNDRRLWTALACRSLTARGWSPTMLAKAWGIPKTNIYRYLETDLVSGERMA